jgi:hypothetical protein
MPGMGELLVLMGLAGVIALVLVVVFVLRKPKK